MENIERIAVGAVVKAQDGNRWRIFSIDAMSCRMIMMDVTKRKISTIPIADLYDAVSSGDASIVEEEPLLVDIDSMPEHEREEFAKKIQFIEEFRKLYGPTYFRYVGEWVKPEYEDLVNSFSFSRMNADRIVRRWLQGGMQESSLANRRYCTGKREAPKTVVVRNRKASTQIGIAIDDRVIEAFNYGVEVYRSGRNMTKQKAHDRMIMKYFMEQTESGENRICAPENRPTMRQFTYYLSKQLSKEEIGKIKTSNREYRNNERLLMGSPRDEALRPGMILEADALEVDINIVSQQNGQQNISRPVIYMFTDIYSHAIVAYHAGFDNNSMMGLSSAMMNLFDDRNAFIAGHNIKADISAWPEPFVPQEIRCDRGSDFASDKFEKICQDLNIIRTLEPAAMGSMKGQIEQSFRLFHQGIKANFEHMGIIQKRHDSNHRKEACLTIHDMHRLLVEFIRFHNTYYTESFRLSADMMETGVQKTPISIWNYGTDKFGPPHPVTIYNRSEILYKLMPVGKASISRQGISFKGLYYTTSTDERLIEKMKLAKANAKLRDVDGKKLNAIDVRYDPRSINNLYYILPDGRLGILDLLSCKCGNIRDLTWDEYMQILEAEKEMDRKGKEMNLANRIAREARLDQIALEARKTTYADASNISDGRRKEKNITNFDNRIQTRLGQPSGLLEGEGSEQDTDVGKGGTDNASSIFSPICPKELWDF